MIPTTPYLIRAIYDWCSDQGFTPHLLVAIFARENGLGCAFETTVDASPGELEQTPGELNDHVEQNPKQQSADHAPKKPGPKKGKADKPTHLKLV
jgi:stringent starvation protein B